MFVIFMVWDKFADLATLIFRIAHKDKSGQPQHHLVVDTRKIDKVKNTKLFKLKFYTRSILFTNIRKNSCDFSLKTDLLQKRKKCITRPRTKKSADIMCLNISGNINISVQVIDQILNLCEE